MIRNGENNSYIEICMYEPENENAIDGNIIISREINLNGRNMCKINGRMVTVNELKDFMSDFLEIHGQNANQNLLNSKYHIKYLDEYIGKDVEELKQKYYVLYQKYNEIKIHLKENLGDEKERQRKIDLLNYQINEIENACLKNGEEEELEEKRKLMMNVEKIEKNLHEVHMSVGENTIDFLSSGIRALEKIEQIDTKYEDIANRLKSVYYEIQEISRDIAYYKDEVYFDEQERNDVETRLDLIYSLKRKYGNTIEEILEYCRQVKDEVYRIENLEDSINKLKKEQKDLEENMEIIAKQINQLRKEKGGILSKQINQNLQELEMKNAKVNICVEYQPEFFENGKDKVNINITTNVGEEEKELSKIASGGEMSRIMLAIKTVIASSDEMPILVFDEIDTGISGKAANSVAEKLSEISKKHQVLCISHLPNIAALGDYNYFISKKIKNNRTNTSIKLLNENEIIKEIARISSGEVNDTTIKYATELRNKKVS